MESIEAKTPKYMVYCVLVACITSLSFGWVIGSPNVPGEITHNCATGNAHLYNIKFPDCLPMTTFLWAFAVASFCLGGFVGAVSCGFLQTRLGRKKTIMLSNAGFIVGSVVVAVSFSSGMMIAGRIICGLSCGVCSLVIPTYIGEISTIRARGAMGCYHQFFIAIGIFLSTLIGMFLCRVPLWRINYGLAGVPALIQTLLMTTCVESPRWLISVNRIEEAHYVLQKLRGKHNIDREFFEIVEGHVGPAAAITAMKHLATKDEKSLQEWRSFHRPSSAQATLVEHPPSDEKQRQQQEEDDDDDDDDDRMMGPTGGEEQDHPKEQQVTAKQVMKDPVMRRMTMTLVVLHVLQQFLGLNALLYYSSMVYAAVYDNHNTAVMWSSMATVDTAVLLVMTVVAAALIDRMGRRRLLFLSETGVTLFAVVMFLGLFFHLSALLIVGVMFFVASFALGMNPIPWLLTIDMCPTYASSTIGSLTTSINWLVNFIVALFFPVVFAAIQPYTFLIFAGIGLIALVFTYFYVPETKNRSIESVVREFEKYRR
ncbi:major facilitator superfamily domain-containing protein [Halteromyces radiatus]|uniref:major facilitator superfamily domain-containing protein n=1 Tax=Halteromyces radiatus TaxID=101107 RepID=UPI00221FD881|nr:major facilitator superfamily domain-containing protein [Halteromyces radiatus]KAI8080028.1 major facilitator superfamily domain-containing protein [Halteromyces radiatus]